MSHDNDGGMNVTVTADHLRESNLIEDIDDPRADELAAEAWQYLDLHAQLTLPIVLETHRLITREQLGEDAGRMRLVNVQVGSHVAPRWQEVPSLLYSWIEQMKGHTALDPHQMHVDFETIHPFRDGNGRTGRMLLWWHQLRRAEEPVLLRAAERQTYYRWFERPRSRDVIHDEDGSV